MSANNWRICPRCKAAEDERQRKAAKKVADSYGKVSIEEHDKLRELMQPVELEETMREDYELSTDDDGEFYVSYRCSCETCDFRFAYEHSELIPLAANAARKK